jgi:hypothetical protein
MLARKKLSISAAVRNEDKSDIVATFNSVFQHRTSRSGYAKYIPPFTSKTWPVM